MRRGMIMGILSVLFLAAFGGCGSGGTAANKAGEEEMRMEETNKKEANKKETGTDEAIIGDTGLAYGQGSSDDARQAAWESDTEEQRAYTLYTADTPIEEVTADPVFAGYGRLIFPVDSGYYSGDTLGDLRLTWYNNIDPDKTVEIANYMKAHAEAGEAIFYDIYTEEEKTADPAKKDTGLFFFKVWPGNRHRGGGLAG